MGTFVEMVNVPGLLYQLQDQAPHKNMEGGYALGAINEFAKPAPVTGSGVRFSYLPQFKS